MNISHNTPTSRYVGRSEEFLYLTKVKKIHFSAHLSNRQYFTFAFWNFERVQRLIKLRSVIVGIVNSDDYFSG